MANDGPRRSARHARGTSDNVFANKHQQERSHDEYVLDRGRNRELGLHYWTVKDAHAITLATCSSVQASAESLDACAMRLLMSEFQLAPTWASGVETRRTGTEELIVFSSTERKNDEQHELLGAAFLDQLPRAHNRDHITWRLLFFTIEPGKRELGFSTLLLAYLVDQSRQRNFKLCASVSDAARSWWERQVLFAHSTNITSLNSYFKGTHLYLHRDSATPQHVTFVNDALLELGRDYKALERRKRARKRDVHDDADADADVEIVEAPATSAMQVECAATRGSSLRGLKENWKNKR